jgi:1-acyl-sn-glycerol-3-phosphate acyltransferase
MTTRPLYVRATAATLRLACRLFGGFRIRGLEHVPAAGPAILISNDLSWADPPAIFSVVRRPCWFMANHFLFDLPVLGRLLPLYGAFPVNREKPDRGALKEAEEHLADGDLVCIFPEGGTTITGRLYPFEGGVALLALRKSVPVVPIAMTGTDRLLPEGARFPRFVRGGVTLTAGSPVHPGEIDPSLPHRRRIEELTRRLYEAVAALLPAEYLPEAEPELGRGSSPMIRTSVSSHTSNRS